MKQKGFTLVELVAVITILALLVLLIAPKVQDIINNNSEKTIKLGIEDIVKTCEEYNLMNGSFTKYSYSDKNLYGYASDIISEDTRYPVSVSVKLDDISGQILVDSNGNSIAAFKSDGKCYKYSNKNVNIDNSGSCTVY